MNYEVLLRPEAEADIGESYRWYEGQVDGLGEEFLRAVDACISLIQRNPSAYAPIHQDVRRALVRKFPFGVFYFVEADRVIVIGCFHVRRNPRQWEERV